MLAFRHVIAGCTFACVALLAGCKPSEVPNSMASAPLHKYQASDKTLLLECTKIDQPSHTERVIAASVYAGGTWEIYPAEKPPLNSVVYYQQQPGEDCRVWSRDESCAAEKVRSPNIQSLCEALDEQQKQ